MHPDYIDELIRREQHRDWQRDLERKRLARVARRKPRQHSGLGRALVEWLHARLSRARQTQPAEQARPTLAYKR